MAASTQVVDLKCGYATNPLGIDDGHPQLSWRVNSDERGVLQQAWQVLVATSPEQLAEGKADAWDSGRVSSLQSTGISYAGKELQSRQRYYWKARVWTNDNTASEWSESVWFEMGLLNPSDWLSGWISYAAGMPGRVLYFKTTWHKDKPVKRARAYISGLGFYEMQINRKKIGDRVLEPAQSTYPKRIYYATYDVTDNLSESDNVILVAVAPGWYGIPSLRLQVEIESADGTRSTITSDAMRHVTTGPVVYATVFDGELYDARLAVENLYKPYIPPGLMNREWGWAYNTNDPGLNMVAGKADPIQVVETITPTSIKEPKPGVYVVDAGRNLAGWAKLRVAGKEGTKITLRFAETLYDSGLVNQENLRNAKAEDIYILSGIGTETWHPAFTYHGFRYVQIEGFPHAPKPDDITVQVVRSAVASTGQFHCSNPLLNDIHRMVVNTEASNLHSIPTDCPQRDERQGWLNDLTVRIEQAIYNFDMSRFYPKFIADVADTQDKDGTITCVAPFRFGMRPADPVSASYLLLAYKSYEFYGNKQVIADHFDGMKAWTDYLYSRTNNGIVNYSYYGDWCPPRDYLQDPNGSGVSRDTPGNMISTGYLYHCMRILTEMADVIGRKDEAEHYRKTATEIATAFNREYWNEQTGGYASNNQASNAFALYMGLVPEGNVSRVVANLVEDVKRHDYHLTTGNLCTKYLLEMLTEHGHAEAAYRIAAQTTYPGWGFMLSKGATTLWERWEYATGDAMNSHNHPMMGSIGSWFYKYLLGIKPDFQHPGFEQFDIKPVMIDDLTFAEGELNTVKGVIKSAWKKNDNSVSLHITVPANTKAIVYVPARSADDVTESGQNATQCTSLKFVRKADGYAVYEAGSGEYQFQSIYR